MGVVERKAPEIVLPWRVMARVFLAMYCLVLLTFASSGVDAKPSRSECIIGFYLDWTQVKEDPADIANAMVGWSQETGFELLKALKLSRNTSQLYLILEADCEKKDLVASRLIDYWRGKELDLPTFERVDEPILPSPETIDVLGPFWSDGNWD